ncbi:hypothetical protein L1987_32386 [Smallanthus sonchifolius]|uniref:Uncharacterized protein n=1 Tax=Smallanthus sonchifolius TaxID=185202 RepID=A0ACB9HP92_9ASTR|nr:hypothetical protein L1987_32386 [Smallanthus sonchifolius]
MPFAVRERGEGIVSRYARDPRNASDYFGPRVEELVVKSKLLMICLSAATLFDADEKPISSNFGLRLIRQSAGNLFFGWRT